MASSFPWRLVTVDIDGTLTRNHGWREIAVAFDRLRDYEETNRRFAAGELDEDAHLTNLLNEVTGHSVTEVLSVVERTPKIAGIARSIARLHELGGRVALLTHNPDYVAEWYRRTFGFDDAAAVSAQRVVGGRIGPPVDVRADKPGGMRKLLERFGVSPSAAVHVGDGRSDARVFREVGGGVALNSSYRDVELAADLAIQTEKFDDVVEGLLRLTPRAVGAGSGTFRSRAPSA